MFQGDILDFVRGVLCEGKEDYLAKSPDGAPCGQHMRLRLRLHLSRCPSFLNQGASLTGLCNTGTALVSLVH